MSTISPIPVLQSYVPDPIARQLAAGQPPTLAPTYDEWPAAGLVVDISGFTRLTETLAVRGVVGAEELSHILNRYFDQMITIIAGQGGQIVHFVGDAVIVVWPAAAEQPLPAAVQRALHCAWRLEEALNGYEAQPGMRLYIKCLLTAGLVRATSVGGLHDRWQYLVTGASVAQIGRLTTWAAAGEVVVSGEAWALVGEAAQGERLADGVMRLRGVKELRPLPPLSPLVLPPETESQLRRYVPHFVQQHLAASRHGWLAELRRLTILFLQVDIDYEQPEAMSTLQRAVTTVQELLYRYEGHWTRIVVDDKGTYLLMVLGLPPFTHENDPLRGVQFALALNPVLAALGVRAALGITTGRVFCGEQGNDTRREYTFLGDVVNLSARLMSAAGEMSQDVGVVALCDETTYQATAHSVTYQTMLPLALKGRATAVTVYQPQTTIQPGLANRQEIAAHWPLLGRSIELAALQQHIEALISRGEDGLALVEGEAGIGKSHLVETALQSVIRQEIPVWYVAAEAIEQHTPYHAWRPLFVNLLGLEHEGRPDVSTVQQLLAERLAGSPALLPLLPLLNPLLPVDLPDTAVTAQMAQENRADNTRDLLLTLLQRQGPPGQPHVLLVEDGQWLDSASWRLLAAVRNQIHPLLILLTGRPLTAQAEQDLPDEARTLLNAPTTHTLRLESLGSNAARELVQQRLGVASLPQSVADLIQRTAEGHPFFSEEIAYALRDEGHIVVADGRCRVTGDLQKIQFPTTIEGVITTRISRLSTEQQLTVKVASVIGRIFALQLLAGIYPFAEEREQVSLYVSDLDRLNITPYYTAEPEVSYIFRHVLSREVAYNLMLYAQRQQMHRAVAEWYELAFTGDLSSIYPLLAYHWHLAASLGQSDEQTARKAIEYLDKAGMQALHNGAMREAAQFLGNLLALLKQLPADSPARQEITWLQEGKWNRYMGQALLQSGRSTLSIAYLEQALILLGFPVHQAAARLALGTAGQYGLQALHRFFPGRYLHTKAAESERLVTAACAYDYLAEAHFNASQTVAAMYYSICRLNVAELAAPSPQLGAYASISMTMGLLTLGGLADKYGELALAAAAEMEDLSTRGLTMLRAATQYMGYCQWDKARQLGVEIRAICEQLNDAQLGATNAGLEGAVARFTGRFQESNEFARQGLAYSQRSGNRLHDTWHLKQLLENSLALGELDEALRVGLETLDLLQEYPNDLVEISVYGSLALVYWRLEERRLAYETAVKGASMIANTLPIAFISQPGHCGVPEVLLRLQEAGYDAPELPAQAAQTVKGLRAYARSFPIARPYLHLCLGLAAWLAGKPDRAYKTWRKGIEVAAAQGMPYPQGLLLSEYGRHLPPEHPERAATLAQAAHIFTALGCRYDLAFVVGDLSPS
ncbi:MAG: AAA family ATPase [Anaerolineae bacterium]|nr:AAA family ATPase [Anaerolineae bacterium]